MKLRSSRDSISFRIARNPSTEEMMEQVGAVYFIGLFRSRDTGSPIDR